MQISYDARVRNLAYNSFNRLKITKWCDSNCTTHPCLWLITWAPTQPVATRPLAIQKDGTWFCYGWDMTKNICEIFGQNGYIRSTYAYTPFGTVTTNGDVTQPIQWSSEYYDSELDLVYYNYRHYNPTDGRWINRDPIAEQGGWNLYGFVGNSTILHLDILGMSLKKKYPILKEFDFTISQEIGTQTYVLTNPINKLTNILKDNLTDKVKDKTKDIVLNKLEVKDIFDAAKELAGTATRGLEVGAQFGNSLGHRLISIEISVEATYICCKRGKEYLDKVYVKKSRQLDMTIDFRNLGDKDIVKYTNHLKSLMKAVANTIKNKACKKK